MKKSYLFVGAILVIAVILGVFLGLEKNEPKIKIGFVGPLSGDMAVFGVPSKIAVEEAAEKMGYKINGVPFEIIYEDGKCSSSGGSEAYNKLIQVDDVDYIIGGLCSPEVLSGAAIAESTETIHISYCASAPKVRTAGDYSFVLFPLDELETKVSAEYIYGTLGVRKVAIIYTLNDWGEGEKTGFISSFEKLGGTIVSVEGTAKDEISFKTVLQKAADSKPELIYAAQFPGPTENTLKDAQQLGIKIPLYIPQMLTPETIKSLGSATNGAYTIKAEAKISDEELIKTVTKKTEGMAIDSLCYGWAYDSLFMLKTAIESIDSFDPEKVKSELYSMSYKGILGDHKFDADGILDRASFGIYKVDGEKLVKIN